VADQASPGRHMTSLNQRHNGWQGEVPRFAAPQRAEGGIVRFVFEKTPLREFTATFSLRICYINFGTCAAARTTQ
jgi:hypothetical protein